MRSKKFKIKILDIPEVYTLNDKVSKLSSVSIFEGYNHECDCACPNEHSGNIITEPYTKIKISTVNLHKK